MENLETLRKEIDKFCLDNKIEKGKAGYIMGMFMKHRIAINFFDKPNTLIQRELLVAYDNFKQMTDRKFCCSEEAIDAFLFTPDRTKAAPINIHKETFTLNMFIRDLTEEEIEMVRIGTHKLEYDNDWTFVKVE